MEITKITFTSPLEEARFLKKKYVREYDWDNASKQRDIEKKLEQTQIANGIFVFQRKVIVEKCFWRYIYK